MNGDKIFNLLGTIVVLAIIATLVVNGTNTAKVISALAGGFSGSITAAQKG